jgi:hypothetical protein
VGHTAEGRPTLQVVLLFEAHANASSRCFSTTARPLAPSSEHLGKTSHDVLAAALSNDVAMADGDVSESTTDTTRNGGVLANLPRTRPQRSSARRAAARESASANGRPSGSRKSTGKRPGTAASTRTGKPARGQSHVAKAQPAKAGPATGAAQTETQPAKPAAHGRPKSAKDSAATAQAKAAGSSPRPSSAVRARRARTGKRAPAPRRPVAVEEPAPRQGFECEGERATGPVQPPGAPELVATAAELVGELAKAGVSAGERLLKDVFSRLPGG